METARQPELALLQPVVLQQPVLVLDQPREPGAACQKRCRLNSWSTMKQQLLRSQSGNADGAA